ncbi:hypothetical protein SAMN05421671_0044 [Pimelobacter simplex]|nr:hypothetical protein NSI01_54920 [Pimelobacter simplex]SFN19097.1 hypothetical protein SAMN05421671_0044 [Pimelobacter simplex]
MTAAGALAITGAALLVAALVLAFAASEADWPLRTRLAAAGWCVFAVGIICLGAAPWLEVAR